MLNMAIKGPLWRRAGGGMTLSPSFWKVSETKISDKVSHVTPLSELNEMVQYCTNPINSSHPVTCDRRDEILVSSHHRGRCDCLKFSSKCRSSPLSIDNSK